MNFAWREFYSTVNFNGRDYKRVIEPYPEYLTNMLNIAHELQKLREYFNKPVIITSGFRTPYFNALISGAKNSQHLYGNAADIRIAGVTSREILDVAREITNFKGFGLSSYFIHMDLRDAKRSGYKVFKIIVLIRLLTMRTEFGQCALIQTPYLDIINLLRSNKRNYSCKLNY